MHGENAESTCLAVACYASRRHLCRRFLSLRHLRRECPFKSHGRKRRLNRVCLRLVRRQSNRRCRGRLGATRREMQRLPSAPHRRSRRDSQIQILPSVTTVEMPIGWIRVLRGNSRQCRQTQHHQVQCNPLRKFHATSAWLYVWLQVCLVHRRPLPSTTPM
jgi:hypothetical protein